MTTTAVLDKKNAGGRPPKFEEPSRPITVTLPESTLEGLRQIDPDRGQAIVKLTQGAVGRGANSTPLVEVVEMVAKNGLIIVGYSAALRRIPFLRLVEVAPGRFLMALEPGNDFKNLEIAIHDQYEETPQSEKRERELLSLLLDKMRSLRKTERMTMAEILFVSLDGKKRS